MRTTLDLDPVVPSATFTTVPRARFARIAAFDAPLCAALARLTRPSAG